jgi:hypothetical protein
MALCLAANLLKQKADLAEREIRASVFLRLLLFLAFLFLEVVFQLRR